MRLINTKTLELEERFYDVPPFAILSHTWGDGEVSFGDWKNLDEARKKEGFRKIELTCQQAAKDGLQYAWVDTNCIDKTSSAELSEAINSMFAWYRDSKVCYVYLKDVSVPESIRNGPSSSYLADPVVTKAFKESRWFTRGWTLQELLAPSNVVFYSQEWLFLATKNDQRRLIREITGIDSDYITRPERIFTASVARRMSFMSNRKTTRVEDTAYCLLGIFGIHMALLYGEGHRAFLRLQEEIIRVSNDQTIFCWQVNTRGSGSNSVRHLYEDTELYGLGRDEHRRSELQQWTSILAPHPRVFRDSGRYFSEADLSDLESTNEVGPFSITNFGLSMSVPLLYTSKGACALLDVGFRKSSADTSARVLISLHRVYGGHYIRLSNKLLVTSLPTTLMQKRTQIFVDCRNAQIRGAELMLSLRLSALPINLSDVNRHPVIFLTFNRPVDLDKTPVVSSGMDFVPFHSAIEVSDIDPATHIGIILSGKTSKSGPFYLLVGGRSGQTASIATTSTSTTTITSNLLGTKEREIGMDWHTDIYDWPLPNPSRLNQEVLTPLIDQLSDDFFGSWCRSKPLKNVLSWPYSPNGALICYFELDELHAPTVELSAKTDAKPAVDDSDRFCQLHRSMSDMTSLQRVFSALEDKTSDEEDGDAAQNGELRTTGLRTKSMPLPERSTKTNADRNRQQYMKNKALRERVP